MKKTFNILLSAIVLVASLGVTGAFADSFSLSSFFTPGYNSNITVVFDDVNNTISLSGDGTYNASVQSQNCYQISGTIEFTFNNSNAPGTNFCNISNATYSNLVGCSANGSYLSKTSGSTSGSFDFSVQNANGYAKIGLNQGGASNQYAVTYTVKSLTVNNTEVISSVVGEWVNFSIKPGYAFVIEGECEILERSYYINNSWSFWGTNNAHRTNGSSERISAIGNIRDGFSVDYGLTRDQLIQWEAMNPNLINDASIYEFYNNDLILLSSGSAFFVSYPLYDGVVTTLEGLRSRENSVDFIGSVYLNYTTRPTFRYVALKSNIDANNKDVAFYNTLQPSITDSSGDVTETPDGTTISPGDIPSGGGDSSTPPLDEDNSLLGTISKFVNDIKRLLSTAVESINTLVSEGSQFMRSVAQMFTWLPEQLTSLLIAAFTILVVVGVLKVLWR